MAVDEKTLAQARKLRSSAMRQVLIEAYPQVWRLAMALSGRENVARWTAHFVCRQAIGVMPQLADVPEMQRWILHHTVLTTRRAKKYPPDANEDALLPADGSASPAYKAFVRAMRNLPDQQREAMILHHGMDLPLRPLAIAMDCSTQAAANHLEAARKSLATLAGNQSAPLLAELSHVCKTLEADPYAVAPMIGRMVHRRLMPRKILRIAFIILCLVLLIGLIWVGTVVWDQMEQ